jgi:hypothetical protein
MEFKSQICTTKEQTERLLALGLKKETADMKYIPYSRCAVPKYFDDGFGFEDDEYIPAWSLHRIVEIMFKGDIEGFVGYNIYANSVNIMYEYAISNIEALIKMGSFNKDYLEERK